ncbi:MAG TPA: alpha/beta hydrolase [Flavilitoribacter sp.]|nr:alpha/beta hydrolase [Flavilitoribacter sp.]
MKWIFRILIGLIILALIVVVLFASCMSFRQSDEKVKKYFAEKGVKILIHHKEYNSRPIRFIESGDSTGQLVIFIHGAPGSSDNFYSYLADKDLIAKARMITVDRLGYGYSDYGHAETSIAVQADMIRHILEMYPEQKAILVGHSYGGPIVARCALDFPERVKAGVLLAPVDDPDTEPMFFVANFAKWKLTRWILSGGNRVSGDEKLTHIAELRKMEPDWKDISVPMVHIQGMKDWMAPPANVPFSQKHIRPDLLKVVEIPETSHFIPWTDYGVVKKELLSLLDRN